MLSHLLFAQTDGYIHPPKELMGLPSPICMATVLVFIMLACFSNLGGKKVFMSLSALILPLLLLAAGVGFLLFVCDGENVLLMKYNQFRISQGRDEQVDDKQDQSMKGCRQETVS